MSKPQLALDTLHTQAARPSDLSGRLTFLALPSLVEQRIEYVLGVFAALGVTLRDAESQALARSIAHQTEQGFARYASARLVINYKQLEAGRFTFNVSCERITLAERYSEWVSRGEPLFGSHPDAMVEAVVRQLGEHNALRVLDVGAGNGRNTLALARYGHSIDALEGTPEFVEQIDFWARRQQLQVRAILTDFLEEGLACPESTYDLIVASQVTSHFRDVDDLVMLFRRSGELLAPGGALVMTIFIADEATSADEFAREAGQAHWSSFFSLSECDSAASEAGLTRTQDEQVVAYERAHLPREAWPPTDWFVKWAEGRDLFPTRTSPIELRWHTYRKT